MALNDRQKKFCEEYAILSGDATCKNPTTQAALNSGYSQKTAYAMGSENLKKPEIQLYMSDFKDKLRKRAEIAANGRKITPEYILNGIAAIAEKEDTKDSDRLRAYELLGKSVALFTDKTEIKGDIDSTITIKFDKASSVNGEDDITG
jgi:phage terminase small subunit